MILEFTCQCCGNKMSEKFFPSVYSLSEGNQKNYLHICKDCVRKKVNNFNPMTYLPLLKILNIPFIINEWNRLINRYGFTGSIFLRYLSTMNLRGFRSYHWEDSDLLNNFLIEPSVNEDSYLHYNLSTLKKTYKLLMSHVDVKYENAAKFYETYLAKFN